MKMNRFYVLMVLVWVNLILWGQNGIDLRMKAEKGDSNAQLELAKVLIEERKLEEAKKWLLCAAKQNNEMAQTFLGTYYEMICMDYKEAMKWFLKAGEQSNGEALYTIGRFYIEGKGVDKDVKTAYQYFKKAAECGDSNGMNMMGVLYLFGGELKMNLVVDVDVYKAVSYFKTSASLGNREGQYWLGVCYLEGTGVPKDKNEAKKWLTFAAEQGDENAKKILDDL